MKKLCFLIAIITLCFVGAAQGANTIIQLPDGSYVGSNNPLPITGSFAAPAAPTNNLQATVAAAPVPIQVTNIANRKSITLVNTSAANIIRVSFDSSTASASASVGTTIFPYGAITVELPSTKYVSIWAAATINVDVLQLGN